MFDTLLIANRGEIACRIIRTARRLGIRTVAVFSDADRHALHVQQADAAYPIGPAPARDSYLNIPNILAAARKAQADAIHPGYGFLSENADFAEATAAAGLTFIGPPPAAIRAMGSKSAAKTLMATAGIPLVPGYHGPDQNPAHLVDQAATIGYPILIKASAGGGGKGMRVVETPAAFLNALAEAQGEARASFADDRILLERYLTSPRHIEFQVFADRHGNTLHLFERDCSIQRRHQKIVEEAPAPGMTPARRAAMGQAACAAAEAIAYEGAGTIEFIVQADEFYFMEMNTRLQVEHPVTEAITGQDLVEWQLRVAAGDPLPLRQQDLRIDGHAIEVRLYAEDPARDYRPSTGKIHHLRQPDHAVRIDTGIRQGDTISIDYDPMLAKLIVHAPTRPEALAHLRAALSTYEVAGVQTNLDLLRAIAASPGFNAGAVDTGYLIHHPDLLATPDPAETSPAAPPQALAIAAAAILQRRATAASAHAASRNDPHSPWSAPTAWRLNLPPTQTLILRDGNTDIPLRCHPQTGGLLVETPHPIRITLEPGAAWLDGERHPATAAGPDHALTIFFADRTWPLSLIDLLTPPSTTTAADERLLAPMPGRIVSLHTSLGATVALGDILIVLEAMKVQMRLAAPRAGTVAAIHAHPGDLVDEATELVELTSL